MGTKWTKATNFIFELLWYLMLIWREEPPENSVVQGFLNSLLKIFCAFNFCHVSPVTKVIYCQIFPNYGTYIEYCDHPQSSVVNFTDQKLQPFSMLTVIIQCTTCHTVVVHYNTHCNVLSDAFRAELAVLIAKAVGPVMMSMV